MIGRISGQLAYRGLDHVMIDVGGVGYLIYCSDRTIASLPAKGGFASLYTDLMVREDLLQLYGFQTLVEKEWYRLLLSVQGVGAKAALAILGVLGPEGVGRAIALGDAASVKSAPGIGPKIAQRVVNELKDKAPSVMAMAGQDESATASAVLPVTESSDAAVVENEPKPVAPSRAADQADALSALANLGYTPGEAATAVAQAARDEPDAGTSELIRLALKRLAPTG
ncbi:Holliday junction branch migration protein RuvA [Qingshengfaniella alkalisoli]|uniref:Holliday junction branch migration complex subunit RuvA n=1 Tax=Qingshengfaniella alkalisoli TaxID=2599296 RepID=A0A5B8I770_9RHOB|nr:Holliday junction branch migration protein RuvA [Qingshengfaniella alkalisoli]QDY69535.1 Holliday junction branch migration protein RuvA [Qingshengfaniella alkalisoli]